MSGIRARDKESVNPMIGAMREASFCHLVVARVFVKQTWKNGGSHIRPDAVVGKGFPIAFPVGTPTLPPGLRIVLCLSYGGKRAIERISGPIENAGRGEPKFLTRGKRGKSFGGLHCAVIRQYFENAVVYSTSFFLQLAFAHLIVRRVFVLRILGLVLG